MNAMVVSNSSRGSDIVAMLEAANITPTCVDSPDSALIHLRGNCARPEKLTSVIIYDTNCGKDVKAFRKLALTDQPHLKVIAFGPKRPQRGPRRGPNTGEHGADFYLDEPFGVGDLSAVIEQMVPKTIAA